MLKWLIHFTSTITIILKQILPVSSVHSQYHFGKPVCLTIVTIIIWTPLFSIFVLKCEVEEASSPSYGVVIRWVSRRWLLLFLSIVRLDWWWFCWHPCPLIISCSKFRPLNCLYQAMPLPLNEIMPTLGCIGLCQPILSVYQSICTKMANDEHRRIHACLP